MEKIAILDDYTSSALGMAEWDSVRDRAEVLSFGRHLSADEAAVLLADCTMLVLMRERMALGADLIARLPRLKFVVFSGPTNAAIDMAALEARGIVVSRTVVPPPQPSAFASPAPAEMAWALLMASARNIVQEDAALRAGRWNVTAGTSLSGRTLGIAGFGKVGRLMARYGAAFGMKVTAWSQNLTPAAVDGTGAEVVSKDDLFARADFLSLHYKLGPRSVGLVGQRELELMKPGAYLINTARGELIDEPALVAALRERRIAGAALDVFCQEPLPADHPLIALPNVVLTPHLGYVTQDFLRSSYQRSLAAIVAFMDGAPMNVVTADLLAAGR